MIDEYMLDHELDRVGDNEWRVFLCECRDIRCQERFSVPNIFPFLYFHRRYTFHVCDWLGEDEEVLMDLNGFKIVGVKDD